MCDLRSHKGQQQNCQTPFRFLVSFPGALYIGVFDKNTQGNIEFYSQISKEPLFRKCLFKEPIVGERPDTFFWSHEGQQQNKKLYVLELYL